MFKFFLLILTGSLAACASEGHPPATTTAAVQIDPFTLQAAIASLNQDSYHIGASDLLKIVVFQVPDLSLDEIRVDASGAIEMPLIGSVQAAGRSPAELSRDIQNRLGERYLQNPRVTVVVAEAASQKITVDGAVTKPGVYVMRGRTSLLQAVAMAEGPTRIANLESVAVFRTVGERRMVAVFDLNAIRKGEADDPVVFGDDVVIVDTSRLSAAIRDAIALMPALSAFRYF